MGTRILDATCGPKGMYRGLHKQFDGEIVFLDKRRGEFHAYKLRGKDGSKGMIEPTVQGDFQQSPFRAGSFSLALFDPPYESGGAGGLIVERYGSLADAQEARRMLHHAAREFSRLELPAVLVSLNDSQYPMTSLFKAYMEKFGFRLLLRIRQQAQFVDSRVTVGNGQEWMLFVRVPSS